MSAKGVSLTTKTTEMLTKGGILCSTRGGQCSRVGNASDDRGLIVNFDSARVHGLAFLASLGGVDVIVVGAGPAGLMAAEVCARAGHRVMVYDQRRSPARKFVLAGRGGLNISHSEPLDTLLARYGTEREHLEPAIRAFTPTDLQDWCAGLGHETFVGSSGRLFPVELRSVPLLRSWLRRLDSLGVTFHLGARWTGWRNDRSFGFEIASEEMEAGFDVAFLALGGASWPRVSSNGSWHQVLLEQGIDITPFAPANCGVAIEWSEVMVDRFAGEPVKNAEVRIRDVASGEVRTRRGDPIVTDQGLEGGPIYGLSRNIRENLALGESQINIDLFPDVALDVLTQRLAVRSDKESTARWLRRHGVAPVGASLMREATGNKLPSDPEVMAALAKDVPLNVVGLSSIDRAISTAGGVAWGQVDDVYQLICVPNVYVVGEMLDWEAPTGGYLLQACFSTAHYAATAWCSRH